MEEKDINNLENDNCTNKIDNLSTIEKEQIAQSIGMVAPRNIADYVNNTMNKYAEQGLITPSDYNVQNAVISSYLIIKQDEKLATCSKDSIVSALIDMATMGLNAGKKQCYFIPYGKICKLSPSYFGMQLAIKRINGVIDVRADVLYKDTKYELINDEFGNDDIIISSPCPLDKRVEENIVGAWCKIIIDKEIWKSSTYTCIMTYAQIKKSWNQGSMKGQSPAHKNFPERMARKTVINRCCVDFVNSAKDNGNDLLISTLNKTIDNDFLNENDNKRVIKETKILDI